MSKNNNLKEKATLENYHLVNSLVVSADSFLFVLSLCKHEGLITDEKAEQYSTFLTTMFDELKEVADNLKPHSAGNEDTVDILDDIEDVVEDNITESGTDEQDDTADE